MEQLAAKAGTQMLGNVKTFSFDLRSEDDVYFLHDTRIELLSSKRFVLL